MCATKEACMCATREVYASVNKPSTAPKHTMPCISAQASYIAHTNTSAVYMGKRGPERRQRQEALYVVKELSISVNAVLDILQKSPAPSPLNHTRQIAEQIEGGGRQGGVACKNTHTHTHTYRVPFTHTPQLLLLRSAGSNRVRGRTRGGIPWAGV